MRPIMPSPAIAVVGRHNSGKTTMIERLIEELTARGLNVGSVKHHSHPGFDIDIPGKDSYRHRAAGATETVIACNNQIARISDLSGEIECKDILADMPGHDIVIVEGYRKSGLPSMEIMRADNNADAQVAQVFLQNARDGVPLNVDTVQEYRSMVHGSGDTPRSGEELRDVNEKMPSAATVAVVSDIPEAREAAQIYDIPCFDPDDITPIADFVQDRFARLQVTVVIQAGGESRRMGQSKALVSFEGRPLIMRLIERVAPAADQIVITTNEGDRLAFLLDEYPSLGIRLVPDEKDYRGALPGLYTAIKASATQHVAVVACDMLFASAPLIVAEAIEMTSTGADVVVPVNKHGFEPFHAMYRRETCLPAIEAALAEGHKRAQAFFEKVNVCEFPQSRVQEVAPMGGCFVNANTPEELRALESTFLD